MINKILTCGRIPSSYFFLLTLASLLEDKKEGRIEKEKLIGASKILMQELDNEKINELALDVDMILSYKYNDLESELAKFIEDYKEIVDLKAQEIVLRDGVSYNKILALLAKIEEEEEFDSLWYEVRILRKKKSFKDYLELNHIKNLYRDLIDTESMVEELYMEIGNNYKDRDKKIQELLIIRNKIYKRLFTEGKDLIKAIQDEENRVKIDYEENYPIDFNLLKKSEYYTEDGEEIGIPLENNFLSIFQIAIFGNIPLAEPKLSNDLNQILCDMFNEEDEDFETISYYENDVFKGSFDMNFGTCFDSDVIFYLTYIKKLEELMTIYGNNLELLNTKKRLIYSLDDVSLSLYQEENIDKVLEEKKENPDFDLIFFDNYDHFQEESLFFIEDIFEGEKGDFTDILKKLAFVATYYELSKDSEIKNKLLNYTNISHYLEYYRFIIVPSSKKLVK